MPKYYTLSGKYNSSRTILATIVVLLLVPIFSFTYNMVNTFIPIIYANVFIAVGYGILLGFGLRFIANFGQVRNNMLLFGIGLLVVIFSIYTYWHAFIAYVFADFSVSISNYLASLMGTFIAISPLEAINEINEFGTWGLGANPNSNIIGSLLWLIWMVEMIIIGGIPLYMLWTREIHPYAEEQAIYYERFQLERPFGTIYSARQTLEKLSKEPVETLITIPDGRAALYSVVSVYYLPNTRFGYLDIDQISVNKKGKKEASTIIDNLEITAADARTILDTFPHRAVNSFDLLN